MRSCTNCNTPELYGPRKICTSCGHPLPRGKNFGTPQEQAFIEKLKINVGQIAHVKRSGPPTMKPERTLRYKTFRLLRDLADEAVYFEERN